MLEKREGKKFFICQRDICFHVQNIGKSRFACNCKCFRKQRCWSDNLRTLRFGKMASAVKYRRQQLLNGERPQPPLLYFPLSSFRPPPPDPCPKKQEQLPPLPTLIFSFPPSETENDGSMSCFAFFLSLFRGLVPVRSRIILVQNAN